MTLDNDNTTNNFIECSPLMCLQAAELLPMEIHWAFLRSAGSSGARIFDEMASLQLLPIYVEMKWNGQHHDDDDMKLVRRSIPISQESMDNCIGEDDEGLTIVYSPINSMSKDVCVFSVRTLRLQWHPSNREIPTHQLSNHNLLTSVHLANFEHVTYIGDWFLSCCSNLKEVDLTTLCNVHTIGSGFMNGCCELSYIDLSPLKNLESMSHYFMSGCVSLRELDVTPLVKIVEIGSLFLQGCTALVSIDMSSLIKVKHIGGGMLNECTSLTTIKLPQTAWPVSRDVGASFLAHTEQLQSIDLTALSGTTVARDLFLAYCRCLRTVDLTPLGNITSIADHFMAHCSGITTLHLGPLSKVTSIGRSFLAECSELSQLDGVEGLIHTTVVGMRFLYRCTSLPKAHTEYRGLLPPEATFEEDIVE